MALRDDIRQFAESTPVPVLPVPSPELPQWDGQLAVTRVSPRAAAGLWDAPDDEGSARDERARFVVLAACDLAGSRVFQDEDVAWLSTSALLSPLVERLYWAAREWNGLTEANRKALRKNLPGTAESGSPCSSAVPPPPATASTSAAS